MGTFHRNPFESAWRVIEATTGRHLVKDFLEGRYVLVNEGFVRFVGESPHASDVGRNTTRAYTRRADARAVREAATQVLAYRQAGSVAKASPTGPDGQPTTDSRLEGFVYRDKEGRSLALLASRTNHRRREAARGTSSAPQEALFR